MTQAGDSARSPHRVVIIGGGFGGLYAAQRLRRAPVQVTLLDRRNFHLFQPLLYQVATGTLSPADIASPLRHVLWRQKNAQVLLAEATGIDVAGRRVLVGADQAQVAVPYDTLIVATGASHNYFGNDWADLAPGLKTIEDATRIRRRVYSAFEAAERAAERAGGQIAGAVSALLTFVIVGGGATGVELAGVLAEIAKNTLRGEFRHIDPASARIVLVEGLDRVLNNFTPTLGEAAARQLRRVGVEVLTGYRVVDLQKGQVELQKGADAATREVLHAHTVLWAAGVQASPLGQILAEATGVELDRVGRVMVEPDCSIKGQGRELGHPEIFVIGDLSHFKHQTGGPLPGVAQTAMQQGRFVSDLIRARLAGETGPREFRYVDLGNMAIIGRGVAVMERGRLRLAGFLAWMAWLFVHLMNLVEYQNRVLVFLQWAWSFLTWNRSARLITGDSKPPPPP